MNSSSIVMALALFAGWSPAHALASQPPVEDRRGFDDQGRRTWPDGWQRQQGDAIRIVTDGLMFGPIGLHPSNFIGFGLPRDAVMEEVERMRGPANGTSSGRCRSGMMETKSFGPLSLNFRDGRFVGWVLSEIEGVAHPEPVIESDLGFGLGARRDAIGDQDATAVIVEREPDRARFEAAGYGGFLSSDRADARVIMIYAGETCRWPRPVPPPDD